MRICCLAFLLAVAGCSAEPAASRPQGYPPAPRATEVGVEAPQVGHSPKAER